MSLTVHSKFGKWRHSGSAKLGPIRSQVNHGRWIVECPCCPSAALAGPGFVTDRFLCAECGNSAAGGRYFEVAWPDRRTVRRIEELLGRRPDMKTRNWIPGEPVGMLLAENIAHDIPGLINGLAA